MKAKLRKTMAIVLAIAVAALLFNGCFGMESALNSDQPSAANSEQPSAVTTVPPSTVNSDLPSAVSSEQPSGKIFLYGEIHAVDYIIDMEFDLWSAYYHNDGMRHLFVEHSYFAAQFLNIWMKSDNDDILNSLFQDWTGTAGHSQDYLNFYKRIKSECPETIFHGTDIGHQSTTTGKRFLEYLESIGEQQSEMYKLSQECMEQGRYYYQHSDNAYRENAMVENFIREYESLDGVDIMGIYGAYHTRLKAADHATNSPDYTANMATQLYEKYGDALHTKDLSALASHNEPYRIDTIKIGDKEYTALYFGREDLSKSFPGYQCREFWRLENAYADFKDNPTTGDSLLCSSYPMEVEAGQILIVEYTKEDGSVKREYYRSDGNTWNGLPTTDEFTVDLETED